MIGVPLKHCSGHLFITLESGDWLVDTGSPVSFGEFPQVNIGDHGFLVGPSPLGLTATTLSQYVAHKSAGLIGLDVLGQFDLCFDVTQGILELSPDPVPFDAGAMRFLDTAHGIPIVQAEINRVGQRCLLDTGAKLSYVPVGAVAGLTSLDTVADFYPMFGPFSTAVYDVHIRIGLLERRIQAGLLPAPLADRLSIVGTNTILGNELFLESRIRMSSRRGLLAIDEGRCAAAAVRG